MSDQPAGERPQPTGSAAKLSCKHVWKIFGDDVPSLIGADGSVDEASFESGDYIGAVRDASFEVHDGETFVIMGLSGSGKSTLLRCMTRLIEPSTGAIHFESEDLMQASEAQLIDMRRHKMGMVFQHFALLPNRSVIGNVAFSLGTTSVWNQRTDRA